MALRKILNKTTFLLLPILLLNSCVLIPAYRPPIVDLPEEWRFDGNESSTLANVRWWECFEDPVLDCLIQEALSYNNDIKVAICTVKQYSAIVGIVKSDLYPQLFGNAIASENEASLSVNPGLLKRIIDDFQLNVNGFWDLDLFGKIRSATISAIDQYMAKKEEQKTVVLTVVSAVARSYIQLRGFDDALEIAKATLESRDKSFEIAKIRYDEGLTSELEVKQAESLVESAAAAIVNIELQIAQQENLISVLIGKAPSPILRGLNAEEWRQPPVVPAGLPAELLMNRPDIVQAEFLLKAANANIGVARADYFPNIRLTGFFGFESLELKDLLKEASRNWQYAARALQSIFQGGRVVNQVAEAEAVKCIAYFTYESVVLNAFKEVEDALIGYEQAIKQRAIQQRRVEVINDYVELARLQYANGQVDYLNVLDAERDLFTAQLDLTAAEASVFTRLIDIYKATAGGWVEEANIQVHGP